MDSHADPTDADDTGKPDWEDGEEPLEVSIAGTSGENEADGGVDNDGHHRMGAGKAGGATNEGQVWDDVGSAALSDLLDNDVEEEATDDSEDEEAEGFAIEFDTGEDGEAEADHEQYSVSSEGGEVTHGFFEDAGTEQSLGVLRVTQGGYEAFVERFAGAIEEHIAADEGDGDKQHTDECGRENFEQRRMKHAAIVSESGSWGTVGGWGRWLFIIDGCVWMLTGPFTPGGAGEFVVFYGDVLR